MGQPTHLDDVDLAAVTGSADPYGFWRAARAREPVTYDPTYDCWLVTRNADARVVLSDPATFSSCSAFTSHVELPTEVLEILGENQFMADNPINLDPPRHTPIRKVWGRAFMRSKVEDLDPVLSDTAERLVDMFASQGRADLMSAFSLPFPAMVIICRLLSVPPPELPQHVYWGHCVATLLGGAVSREQQVEAARGFVEQLRYWEAQLDDRRRSPRDDLLTAIVEECDADPDIDLTARELAYLPLGLSTAGHVTTAQAISFGVLLFLAHPDQRAAALADAGVMATAVDEILRFESPAQMIRRTTTRSVDLSGTTIPAGAHVMAVVGSANHDPDAYETDPDMFDVCRRDAAEHLTFSRGAHFCLGATLARHEIPIALETLFRRLPNLRLPSGGRIERTQHSFHRGFERLDLEWDPPAS